MDNMKNIKKNWMNSLSFLDNNLINSAIVIILVLYCSTIFDNINNFVGNLYNYSIVRVIILLLIIYVAPKDTTIAVLLALSFGISLNYTLNNEYFYGLGSRLQNRRLEKESFNNPVLDHKYIANQKDIHENAETESFNNPVMKHKYKNAETESFNNPVMKRKYVANQKESFKNNSTTKEHFFPFDNNGMTVEPDTVDTSDKTNDNKSCMQNYTPKFESVGDVCSPTATFKNEFNAQGLNYPEGYLNTVIGSPLTQT